MSTSARPAAESIEFPQGDYLSPGLAVIKPDAHFPNMIIGDKNNCDWEYLRREVDHNWYVDRRWPSIGFLDRDEAHILYNSALQFRKKRALEIGCWLGWSACHLALAGVDIDVIDPLLADSRVQDSVTASLSSAAVSCDVVLVPGKSPEAVLAIAGEEKHKWSFIFIDGDHRHPSPVLDAHAAHEKPVALDILIAEQPVFRGDSRGNPTALLEVDRRFEVAGLGIRIRFGC